MTTLQDKVAVVTGSTAGIGGAIAGRLASYGAHVIITGRSMETAEAAAAGIRAQGGRATPCRFDLEDPSTIESLLSTVTTIDNRLDILVNNALSRTVLPQVPIQDLEPLQLQVGVNTNFSNVLALTLKSYNLLKQTKGCVLNIGSVVVNRNIVGYAIYTIIKGALTQSTRALAAEWASEGIRVNQINPGFVMTDTLQKQLPPEHLAGFKEQFSRMHPLGRIGEVQDVSSLAAYMVSDDASWMTGSVVDIDGGYSVQGLPAPG